jgi:hypothetical protein
MPIDKRILEEYIATANSGKYASFDEINSKFPELKDYDPMVLEEYVATANSGKYSTLDDVNKKFPEFFDEVKKKEQAMPFDGQQFGGKSKEPLLPLTSSTASPSVSKQPKSIIPSEFTVEKPVSTSTADNRDLALTVESRGQRKDYLGKVSEGVLDIINKNPDIYISQKDIPTMYGEKVIPAGTPKVENISKAVDLYAEKIKKETGQELSSFDKQFLVQGALSSLKTKKAGVEASSMTNLQLQSKKKLPLTAVTGIKDEKGAVVKEGMFEENIKNIVSEEQKRLEQIAKTPNKEIGAEFKPELDGFRIEVDNAANVLKKESQDFFTSQYEQAQQQIYNQYNDLVQSGQMPADIANVQMKKELETVGAQLESDTNILYAPKFEQLKKSAEAKSQEIQTRYNRKVKAQFDLEKEKASKRIESEVSKYKDALPKEYLKEYQTLYQKNFENAMKMDGIKRINEFANLGNFEKMQTALMAGWGDVAGTVGGSLSYVGLNTGGLQDWVAQSGLYNELPIFSEGSVLENITNTDWWIANGVRSVPFTIATMPIGLAGGAGAGMLAKALGAGKRAQMISSVVGGGLVGWDAERFLEAGGAFNEAINEGKSAGEAAEIAAAVSKYNYATIPLNIAQMLPVFGKSFKFLNSAAIEAGSGYFEEVTQGWAQAKAKAQAEGQDVSYLDYLTSPQAIEEGIIGAGMSQGFTLLSLNNTPNIDKQINALMTSIGTGGENQAALMLDVMKNNGSIDSKQYEEAKALLGYTINAIEQTQNVNVEDSIKSALINKFVAIEKAKELLTENENDLASQAAKELIVEKENEIKNILKGSEPVYLVKIVGNDIPVVSTKEEVESILKNEKALPLFEIEVYNDIKTQASLDEAYSKQNKDAIQDKDEVSSRDTGARTDNTGAKDGDIASATDKGESGKGVVNQEEIERLRAQEQVEVDATDPNDQEKLDEIYNRYNELITPLLEGEKEVKYNIDEARQQFIKDNEIEAFQEKFGYEPYNPFESLPDGVYETILRVEDNTPTSLTAIEEASKWLYSQYKMLEAKKVADTRDMTIPQIDEVLSELEGTITELENFKNKLYEESGQAKGGQDTSSIQAVDGQTSEGVRVGEEIATPTQEVAKEEATEESKAEEIGSGLLSFLGIPLEVESKGAGVNVSNKSALSELEGKVKGDKKSIIEAAKKALATLKSVFPDMEIYIHEDPESYNETMSEVGGVENSRGNFAFERDTNDNPTGRGRIDINLSKAKDTTVAHELTHAVLLKEFGDNPAVFKTFRDKMSNILRADLNEQVAAFEKLYAGQDVAPEEYLTELAALLSQSGETVEYKPSTLRRVAALINEFVSKITKGKFQPFKSEVDFKNFVDFLNQITGAIRVGDVINNLNDKEAYSSGASIPVSNFESFVAKKVSEPVKSKSQIGNYKFPDSIKILKTADLPIKNLTDLVKQYKGKVVIITSDATGYGVDKNGDPIFGGFGFSANAKNVNDGIGFASVSIGTVKGTYTAAEKAYGEGKSLVLVMIQPPHTTINNSYGSKYIIRGIKEIASQSKEELAKTKEAIIEFIKNSTAIQNELKTNETSLKRGSENKLIELIDNIDENTDLDTAVDEFIADTTFTIRKELGKGIILENKDIRTNKSTNYAKIALNNAGYNIFDFLKEYGDNTFLSDDIILNNTGGFVVGGFELDILPTEQREELINNIQNKGIVHPLFNAKLPGSNHFRLDGLYDVQENFSEYVRPETVINLDQKERDKLVRKYYTEDRFYSAQYRSIPLNKRTYTQLTIPSKTEFKEKYLRKKGALVETIPNIATKVAKGEGFIPKAGAAKQMAVATMVSKSQRVDKASDKLKDLFQRDNIPLTIAEAKTIVEEVYDWTTWYDGLTTYVYDIFGEYSEDVLSMLPLASMAANSSATVGLAINNAEKIYRGEKPSGVAEYYGYVTDFLEGKGIKSDKMSEFFKALTGNKDAIAVDMHVYSIIMGKNPNKKQVNPSNKQEFDKAKEFVRTLASELDLAPREVQAALWAANILRTGGRPDSYEQYFKKQIDEKGLKERIENWRNKGYKPFSEIRKDAEASAKKEGATISSKSQKAQNEKIKEYIDAQRKAGQTDKNIRAGIELIADRLGLSALDIDNLMDAEKIENSKKAFEFWLNLESDKEQFIVSTKIKSEAAKAGIDEKALKNAAKTMKNISEIREKLLNAKVIETIDCKWG